MNKVFIVILNWKRPDETLESLGSVGQLSTSGYKLNVVVVDNGSKENSYKKLKDIILKNADYKLIRNQNNLGYAGGMNVGIRYSLNEKADYVVLLNNDTLLDKEMVVELLKTAQENKKTGILCPKIYFNKGYEFYKDRYKDSELGKVIWYAGGIIDWANVYGKNRGVDEVDKGQYNKVEDTDFATGNCMFIRSDVLRQNGLFDEKYFMYLEDVDLCVRYKKAGWSILYSPNAVMWHKVAQSSGIGSELNDYFITRNRMYFGLKYAPIRSRCALMRESLKLLFAGRKWQKIGIKDFYLNRFGKGSWTA